MKWNEPKHPNDTVVYFNKVKEYIRMEYGEEIARKMSLLSNINVTTSYCNNCFSLNKSVPQAANMLAKYLKETL